MGDTSLIQLSNGGEVEVSDYSDGAFYIDVRFPDGTESIAITQVELSGRELQIVVRERYT